MQMKVSQTPSSKGSAPNVSQKGKMVLISRTVFDEFARKPEEEKDSNTEYDNVLPAASLKAESYDENSCFEPVATHVCGESLDKKELQNIFGEKYNEGHSKPRIFAVRIYLNRAMQEQGFVVFQITDSLAQRMNKISIQPDTKNDTCAANIVSIRLTLKCNIPNDQMHTTRHKLIERLSCIDSPQTIQQLVEYVEEDLAAICSPKNNSAKTKQSSSTGLLSYLAHFNGWQVEYFDEDDAHKIVQDDNDIESRSMGHSSPVNSTPRTKDDLVCGICDDPFECNFSGCALQLCNHWFCTNCWRQHLESRVMQGDQLLSCPGHNCNMVVDVATVLLLLPYSYYIKYKRYTSNTKLESSNIWKWCQGDRGRYRRAIRATSAHSEDSLDRTMEERICVSCHCGTVWCFDCGKEAHWPATCKQAQLYIEQIRKRGDKETLKTIPAVPRAPPVVITMKGCPRCKTPIEKNGGCIHMRCRFCKCNYCAICLLDLDKFEGDKMIRHGNLTTPHGEGVCKENEGLPVRFTDVLPTLKKQKSAEAFECATYWRKYRHQMFKRHSNSPVFLHDWIFLLEWCYVVLFVSCAMKINCNWVQAHLNTIKFLANSVENKFASKFKDTRQIDTLKKDGKEPMWRLCTGMKRLQRTVMQQQQKWNLKNEI